jgi:hypothetical protein
MMDKMLSRVAKFTEDHAKSLGSSSSGTVVISRLIFCGYFIDDIGIETNTIDDYIGLLHLKMVFIAVKFYR